MSGAVFTPGELARVCGGEWVNGTPEGTFSLNTDSRTIADGECFVPLAGERFDGHDFLAALAASGKAVTALCQRGKAVPAGMAVLLVADTLRAYQALAGFHRSRMTGLKVIGVTGSVGKTSVKEMLRAVFSRHAGAEHVLYTEGNTNNQIGAAQNLLRLVPEHRFAVIEMGTNHHGEIAPLARMARPDAALVNSIAPCHLEFLGDLDGVAREKSAIFSGVISGGGAVFPAECAGKAILRDAAERFGLHSHTFGAWGTPGATVTGRILKDTLYGSRAELRFPDGQTVAFDWQLGGEVQALNAAAAAAMALHFGLAPEEIASGLRDTALPGKRMKVEERDGICWINDAYNANPASMEASLRHLRTAGGTARDYLLVLGDMRELGDDAVRRHEAILDLVKTLFADTRYTLFLLGEHFGEALAGRADAPESRRHFDTLEALKSALRSELADGRERTVFLKSSNGLKLHTLEPFA